MLDVALGLDLETGSNASIARQHSTLLDILISAFADKLLAQVRRGLPRLYRQIEDDLPALRGRLDVPRQFTRNAVRPDRLSCQFDELSPDTPLMRIMAAAAVFLARYARSAETRRKLDELRYVFAEIPLLPIARLPWKDVRIDRTNRRWESLFRLACLLLQRDWQALHHAQQAPAGLTLLFPMNDLFEKYVAALLRRALAGRNIEVVDQGGLRACLGQFVESVRTDGDVFRTRPDIILKQRGEVRAILDTKWKKLSSNGSDRKLGVSQADVYQLMAYARLYPTKELMLLYPEIPGRTCGKRKEWGITGGFERLQVATIDISCEESEVMSRLAALCAPLIS
jgi:5-methylcytosine-specific restriction enzyme subunit McrC